MRILFYEPFAINTPHFERCLELMQIHLDKNDKVFFVGCSADLLACDVNFNHNFFICQTCITRKKRGLKALSHPVTSLQLTNLSDADKKRINTLKSQTFESIEILKKLKVENFDIGLGVASSLISTLRNPNPDVHRYRKNIARNIESALIVYFSILNHLRENEIDLLYQFNGRLAVLKAAWRAAEAVGVNFYTHEIGFGINEYSLYFNAIPHNIQYQEERINDLWNNADPKEREKVGAQFYEDKLKGNLVDKRYFFTRNQKSGLLPDNWDPGKQNIVIFNSSDDEFAAIGDEWKLPYYASQLDGLKQIIGDLEPFHDRIHLYLRIHPNFKTAKPEMTQVFLDLTGKNLTVIEPTSKISTYSLMASCNKVVTFLSTAGIEAAFMKKPSIVLSKNLYSNLGSTYNPASHEEVIQLITQENIEPKAITGALKFGYYQKTMGIPYKYFKPESLFKGTFKGKPITYPWLTAKLGEVFKKLHKLRTGIK